MTFRQVSILFFLEFHWLDQWFDRDAASYCTLFTSPEERLDVVILILNYKLQYYYIHQCFSTCVPRKISEKTI